MKNLFKNWFTPKKDPKFEKSKKIFDQIVKDIEELPLDKWNRYLFEFTHPSKNYKIEYSRMIDYASVEDLSDVMVQYHQDLLTNIIRDYYDKKEKDKKIKREEDVINKIFS